MALTSDEQTRLASLQAAYDALISGQQVASTEYGGVRTSWSQGHVPFLRSEIERLRALETSPHRRTRGAIRFRL